MKEQISTIILTEDDKINEILSFYLGELNTFLILGCFDNYSEIFDVLASSNKALLVIDLTNNETEKLDFIAGISKDIGHCRILALAENPTVDTIVKAIRLGVDEIINLPILKNELVSSLKKIESSYSECVDDNNSNCKIISIYSNKGGIGKTSIACNLALELAKITKEKVALIDFNTGGDISTFTNIAPHFELSYVLNNLEQPHDKTVMDLGIKYQNTDLYIYAERQDVDDTLKISQLKLKKILYSIKKHFSYVIIDMGTVLDDNNIAILSESDLVLLVAIANLPQLRNSQRVLNRFQQLGISNVEVLLNRFMENDEIDIDTIENLLNHKIFWKIPNNYFTIMSSINKGIPVSAYNANSNIAVSYEGLAIGIIDKFLKDSIKGGYFGT